MTGERDQQRRRIVNFTLDMLEAWSRGDWEKVISAAGDIEQVAGELKQADETDEEI
jgi:hypothetical protein